MTHEPAALAQVSATFICPDCKSEITEQRSGDEARLTCSRGHSFPIVRGVPRFVASEAYADSFGVEWQRFPHVQLDSRNGTRISLTRFKQITGIDPSEFKGQKVLDVGCGPGRFLELIVNAGADAFGADMSLAALT